MPWSYRPPQTSIVRISPEWRHIRSEILRRDRRQCQVPTEAGPSCLARANEVDHIDRGNNHRPENLRAIGRAHHAQKSSQEGTDEKRRLARLSRRDREPHPFETWT